MPAFVALANTETVSGSLVPVVPSGWSASYEADGWYSVTNGSAFFHARLMLTHDSIPDKAVFIVAGERDRLRALYQWLDARGVDVWTISQLRADNSQKATRVKQAWRDEHKSNGEPALLATMAGFDYSYDLERTGDLDL